MCCGLLILEGISANTYRLVPNDGFCESWGLLAQSPAGFELTIGGGFEKVQAVSCRKVVYFTTPPKSGAVATFLAVPRGPHLVFVSSEKLLPD